MIINSRLTRIKKILNNLNLQNNLALHISNRNTKNKIK